MLDTRLGNDKYNNNLSHCFDSMACAVGALLIRPPRPVRYEDGKGSGVGGVLIKYGEKLLWRTSAIVGLVGCWSFTS